MFLLLQLKEIFRLLLCIILGLIGSLVVDFYVFMKKQIIGFY